MYYHSIFSGFFSLFWVFLILYFVFRAPWGRRCGRYHNTWHMDDYDSNFQAEKILKERFAKGEIDEKEYSDRLATLRKNEISSK